MAAESDSPRDALAEVTTQTLVEELIARFDRPGNALVVLMEYTEEGDRPVYTRRCVGNISHVWGMVKRGERYVRLQVEALDNDP